MTSRYTPKTLRAVLALALLLGAMALAACSQKPATSSTTTGATAKDNLPKAQSTLSTAAPDAKLLVAQSYDAITPTSTPGWEYLFGSPKSGKVYAVLVMGGKSQFMEYGAANLTPAQWAAVPSTDQWKIDSDVALQKALAVYPKAEVFVNPDCGFGTFSNRPMNSTEIARAKLKALAEAARSLRG